jgi:endonuclease/exonuclease/phosphatase family metal-dependent hydrolase
MVKMIAWNIAQRGDAWRLLLESDADIALLQEAKEPPSDVTARVTVDANPWQTGSSRLWRTAIVKLSNRTQVEWLQTKPLDEAGDGDLAVSRPGTLTAAIVAPPSGNPFIAMSVYAPWEKPHSMTKKDFIYADASVHRLISDLSVFAAERSNIDIIIAGDLNVLFGYGEHNNLYWAARYETVFHRMEVLGFAFAGPQAPNGRRAEPWPKELPRTSNNVPTYHTRRQTPATCTRQLDFVFVSRPMFDRVRVKALNQPEEWGASDHCRIQIDVI